MAKQIEFGKFKIIECTANELKKATASPMAIMAVCDFCGDIALADNYKGYYIAVLNQWLCEKCFADFKKRRPTWYPQDAAVENRNFETYARLLGLKKTQL